MSTNTDTCTQQDQETLSLWINSNDMVIDNEANSVLDTYMAASLTSLNRLVDYSKRRADYDYNYFVGIKIQRMLELLKTFPSLTLSLPAYNLTSDLQFELQGFLDAFSLLQSMLEIMEVRLGDFYASLQAFKLHYTDILNRLRLARGFVIDFLPNGVKVPDFLNMDDIPLPDVLLPQIFEVPQFAEMPDIHAIASKTIQRILILIARLLTVAADEVSDKLYKALHALYEALEDLSLLDDYDPPKYIGTHFSVETASDELTYLSGFGQAAKRQMEKVIFEMQIRNRAVLHAQTELPIIPMEQTIADDNFTTFDYLKPEFPTVRIPRFFKVFFVFLLTHQWLVEIVIQTCRLWVLKRKYERDATPDLPEINLNTGDDDEEVENKQAARLALLREAIFRHLVTPWMTLTLVSLPLFMVGALVWIPHVYSSCLETRQGTFVARRLMAPLLINQANVPGHLLHARNERQCRLFQQTLCNNLYRESDNLNNGDLFMLYSAQANANNSLLSNGVLERCVNISLLDEAFEHSCCGLEGYGHSCGLYNQSCAIDTMSYAPTPFRPLGEYLSNSACHTNLTSWHLEDAQFQCNVFDNICNSISCNGVDETYILLMTIEGDCDAEVYLVQVCILALLCLYHAIMVNFCCTLVFHGIKRFQWRRLRPDGIKLRTRVNVKGEFIKGGDLEERVQMINQIMRRFELVGYMQIAAGVVCFILWFVSFFVLRKQLSIYK
jgi:hypothetical protein